MKRSTLLAALGFASILYTPVAFAQVDAEIVRSTQYNTFGTGITIMDLQTPGAQTQLSRAEFTKMVVNHLYTAEEIEHCYWDIASTLPPTFTLLYTDVPTSASYAKELCIAMRDGLAKGYSDGSFRPGLNISFADASKILSRAYVLTPFAEATGNGPWFEHYAFALGVRNAIPATVTTFQHSMTAGETRDMLERLSGGITWRPATSYDTLVLRSTPRPPVVKSAPKPVSRFVQPSASVQASAASSAQPAMKSSVRSSKAVSMSSASAVMNVQSSSKGPWYKFY